MDSSVRRAGTPPLGPPGGAIELERFGLGVARLEVELREAHLSRRSSIASHQRRAHTSATLIGSNPQTLDLADVERGIADRAKSHAADEVCVETRDEEGPR